MSDEESQRDQEREDVLAAEEEEGELQHEIEDVEQDEEEDQEEEQDQDENDLLNRDEEAQEEAEEDEADMEAEEVKEEENEENEDEEEKEEEQVEEAAAAIRKVKEESEEQEEQEELNEEVQTGKSNNELSFPGLDDDDELSDLDEEQFQDEKLIDESVFQIKSYRRDGGNNTSNKSKEKTRERKKQPGGKISDDGTILSDDDDDYARNKDNFIPDEDIDPETRARRELERKLDEALKPASKKRRLDGDDIEQMQDEKISNLREQMRSAAIADAECIRNGVPAINKLKLLPEVRDILRKQNLADSILDNNLLEAVRQWLEPLPDASLPGYEIQRELFEAIDRLPIKTIHLRESGLGKVVLFYQKSKRPQLVIKRTADRLIGKWTRPIMGRSDNYRDKAVVSRNYDPIAAARRAAIAGTGTGSGSGNDIMSNSSAGDYDALAEAAAARRNRAAIPNAKPVTYDVAPLSNLSGSLGGRRATGEDQFRRMKLKMSRSSVKSRKSGVSIEGKELRN